MAMNEQVGSTLKLVTAITFAEWAKDGRIRHSLFHALRAEKVAGNATRERSDDVEQLRPRLARSVKVSNADRVIDPYW